MAGGVRSEEKRDKIRKLLLKERWQQESDTVVAREAGCSRWLVSAVRICMLAAGEHPPMSEIEPARKMRRGEYPAGRKVRGGYRQLADGSTVSEREFLFRKARGAGKGVVGLLRELLAKLEG